MILLRAAEALHSSGFGRCEDGRYSCELFNTIKKELIELISQAPETGEQAIDLLMIAKYFERIGDHAENIAEWVEFSISGIHKHKGELLV